MKASRREALLGALVVPAAVGLPGVASARSGPALLLHDPALAAARRMAQTYPGEALAIEGDRIRFARAVFARRPSLVVGVSRAADALLIEDVGREAGYAPVEEGSDGLRQAVAGRRGPGRVLTWVLAPCR